MASEEPTVSIKQATQIVGVSRRTIYNWIDRGKVQYRRTAGGAIRIYPSSLWKYDSASASEGVGK